MLLRGISATYESQVRELFSKPMLRRIMANDLLVQTEISEYSSDDYPLILKHERIPITTYPTEWSPEALRAAATTVLDLQEALLDHGCILGDINPWNILFRRTRPIFVDFGSLLWGEAASVGQFLDEFNRYYLWPLILAKKGLWRYVINLFGNYNSGVLYGDALLLLGPSELTKSTTLFEAIGIWLGEGLKGALPESAKIHLRRFRNRVKSRMVAKLSVADLGTQVRHLRELLSAVQLPKGDGWTRYYEEFPKHGQGFDQSLDWNQKQLNVRQILSELSPKSLFDMCSNRGWYSQLAESLGIRVVSADIVPEVMNQLYLAARIDDRDIHPIVMDFCYPSPARGVANKWFSAATERFRSEMVMCLAAMHNLVFGSQLSFDQIVSGLASFSERWLLIEFISKEDETAGKYWNPRRHDWYTESNFVRALEQQFRVQQTYSSFPEKRKLFLCERRNIG